MIFYSASAVWSYPVLSLYCTEHGPSRDVVLSDHITTVGMSRSVSWVDATLWRYTVAACTFVGTSVTHECALKTHEASYVPKAAKSFFISVIHSPPGAVEHVAASKLPSKEGRAQSRGTHDSTRAHLSQEARSRAEGHVITSELTSTERRQGPTPRYTWQH
jgi:hypothetical protein